MSLQKSSRWWAVAVSIVRRSYCAGGCPPPASHHNALVNVKSSSLAGTASRCRRTYNLPLWFFHSFFRRLISEVTEQISAKLGHIFTYDSYLKNFVRTPPGYLPTTGWGHAFGGPNLNFDWTYLCNGTWYQQSETGTTCLQIWWTLVQKRLRTVGEFLPTPLNFHIGKDCQPYRMDVI